MRNFSLNREQGFTILEVVFAVSILAIGIMGYTALKVSNRYSLFYAKNLSQAVRLTGAQLEGLLLSGYDSDEMDGITNGGVYDLLASSYDLTNAVDQAEYSRHFTAGDFTADEVNWTVKEQCPSELTKLVSFTTVWGSKSLTIAQVQVRP